MGIGSLGMTELVAIFIIVLVIAVVVAVYIRLYRTGSGRRMRAVMQNRQMASALGVRSRRVDAMTFGLGTGLAGVAGVVLGALPVWVLLGALPSLLLAKPLAWCFGDTSQPVPIPALGSNVIWNLATNTLLAIGFVVAILLR